MTFTIHSFVEKHLMLILRLSAALLSFRVSKTRAVKKAFCVLELSKIISFKVMQKYFKFISGNHCRLDKASSGVCFFVGCLFGFIVCRPLLDYLVPKSAIFTDYSKKFVVFECKNEKKKKHGNYR